MNTDTTTDSTRLRAQMAVMSIFRDLGLQAGEALPIDEIARRWGDYGIRASDLDGALEALLRKGLITREGEARERISKTRAGEAWFAEQPAWVEYQLLVPRALRAAFMRQHGERKPGTARRRRREDTVSKRGSLA